METLVFLLRWTHLIAGVVWIGALYFFNFFLEPFARTADRGTHAELFSKMVPRALWGFRWGGLVTFLSGGLMYAYGLAVLGSELFFSSPYGPIVSVGGLMGTVMFLNGWFIMHPNQEVVIESASRVAGGGQPIAAAQACGRRVVLTSRTNLLLSFPTLFFMEAASHYPAMAMNETASSPSRFWIVVLVIIGAIEINILAALRGVNKRPLDSVSASAAAGLLLTGILYLSFRILL